MIHMSNTDTDIQFSFWNGKSLQYKKKKKKKKENDFLKFGFWGTQIWFGQGCAI